MEEKLGFTFYPQNWWTSDSFFLLQPFERYIFLECIFMMYNNNGWLSDNKLIIERRLGTAIKDNVWSKITDLMIKDGDQFTLNSVSKRLKKTISNRKNGKLGGAPKGNQNAKKTTQKNNPNSTQNNPPSLNIKNNTVSSSINTKNNIESMYGYPFVKIDDFHSLYKTFEFDKRYLFLAYKFWQLWYTENPNYKSMQDAKVSKWYDAVRLIVEVDKQKPERLIGVYCYFKKCSEKISGFDDFWYKTVKSVTAFRNKDKGEIYYLDKIISVVNDKIEKDDSFSRLVQETIQKFNR